MALEHNPLMLAAGEYVQASLARVRQARGLPQPSLDIDSDLQPGLTDFGGYGERYVGISQTVPFPLRTWVEGRMARQESNEVVTDREILALDLTFQVTEGFYALLLAGEQDGYARLNLELAQDFLAMTEAKLAAGDVPRVEVVRAGVEVARATNEARKAEAGVRLARARVNALLARAPTDPLEPVGELRTPLLSLELDRLRASALESRPEIRKNAFGLERESYRKKAGYLSYLPDFDLGAAKHTIPGELDTWDVTLSLSLPAFFWQPATGAIAEADATLRALREERAHLVSAVNLEVEETYSSLVTAGDQIRVFEEELLPQAEEAYEMYLFSYQQGEISALDLIEARRTLTEARTSYADALYDYDIAKAGLERSVGRPLQEQNHDIDSLVPDSGRTGSLEPSPGVLRERQRLQQRSRGGGGNR